MIKTVYSLWFVVVQQALQTIIFLFILHFFFQLANLPVEPDEVGDYSRKDGGYNGHHNPYFAIRPEPVSHLNTVRNRLLSHQVLTEQKQSQQEVSRAKRQSHWRVE